MIIKLIIIVIITIILYKFKDNIKIFNKKSNFWKYQSVQFDKNQKNIQNTLVKYDINKDIIINTVKNNDFSKELLTNLYKFLIKNYDELISYNYLSWILKNKNNYWILFQKNNYIVGSLSNILVRFQSKYVNKTYDYIDFLCLEKKSRNKNLAQAIITEMMRYVKQTKHKTAIFKIENKKLPFFEIITYNYYAKSFDYFKNKQINNKDKSKSIKSIKLFDEYYALNKNIIHKNLTTKEYIGYFENNTDFYIFINKSNLFPRGFIYYYDKTVCIGQIRNKDEKYVIEIFLYYSLSSFNNELFKNIINKILYDFELLDKEGIILLLNQKYHKELIINNFFDKSKKVSIYSYNEIFDDKKDIYLFIS